MKRIAFVISVALLAGLAHAGGGTQDSTFTYQGRLTDNGSPADGMYEVRFRLWSSQVGGFVIDEQTMTVQISDGLFSAPLSLGDAISNDDVFLGIGTRQAGMGGAFTELSPRQPVTAAPRASFAHRVPNQLEIGESGVVSGRLDVSDFNGGPPGFSVQPAPVGSSVQFSDRAGGVTGYIEPDVNGIGSFFQFAGQDGSLIYDGGDSDGWSSLSMSGGSGLFSVSPSRDNPDERVVLPASSVSALELGNEPGVASSTNSNPGEFLPTTFTPITTRTITCPSSGYLFVVGSAGIGMTGNGQNVVYFGLSLDGSTLYNGQSVYKYNTNNVGDEASTMTMTQVIPVGRGDTTVSIIARSTNPSFGYYGGAAELSILFVPTSYGGISERVGPGEMPFSELSPAPGSAPMTAVIEDRPANLDRVMTRQRELEAEVAELRAKLDRVLREQEAGRQR